VVFTNFYEKIIKKKLCGLIDFCLTKFEKEINFVLKVVAIETPGKSEDNNDKRVFEEKKTTSNLCKAARCK
jgi:hypothetical protein